jgi:3-phenylpropionate/trans-cinnamate dioxygenase ferredoxin component
MTEFLKVCSTDDIAKGTTISAAIEGLEIAIVHAGDGNFYAIRDVCSHANVPLSEGEVEGCTLECWLHGSRFDLRTGKPTGLPATEAVPIYPVRIDGDDVYVAVKE